MADNMMHLPPPWAAAKDRTHRAWQSFLSYMKEDGEEPTPKLWTLWHAAFLRGETAEMKRQFKLANEARDLIEALAKTVTPELQRAENSTFDEIERKP